MRVTSVFNPNRQAEIDPYGPNPLAEDMQGGGAYAMAIRHAPPPKMFQGGMSDLPAFTASGLDPKLLMSVPYSQRHYLAAEPDMAVVHSLFEQYGHEPGYTMEHEGLDAAKERMSKWASTAGIDPIKEANDAAAQTADAKRAADLATLPPERLAAIHAAATQPR